MRILRLLLPVLRASLLLAACATKPALAPTAEPNDPLEDFNRASFETHMALDQALFLPAAKAYRVVPTLVRNSVRNFINNLDSPVIFANDILQGDIQEAGNTFARFYVNTTFGIGGLFDLGENVGLPRRSEDFGQTLAVYGVDEGPYLFIPIVGPAPARDLAGWVVDLFFDPLSYMSWKDEYYWPPVRAGLDALDLRERNIEAQADLEEQSVDFYASVRSLYRQTRNNEITNGDMPVEELPNF